MIAIYTKDIEEGVMLALYVHAGSWTMACCVV